MLRACRDVATITCGLADLNAGRGGGQLQSDKRGAQVCRFGGGGVGKPREAWGYLCDGLGSRSDFLWLDAEAGGRDAAIPDRIQAIWGWLCPGCGPESGAYTALV